MYAQNEYKTPLNCWCAILNSNYQIKIEMHLKKKKIYIMGNNKYIEFVNSECKSVSF